MVPHQAVRPDRHSEPLGESIEQAEVGSSIVVGAKDGLAVVAAMRDVKRPAFQHDPCESGHRRGRLWEATGIRRQYETIKPENPESAVRLVAGKTAAPSRPRNPNFVHVPFRGLGSPLRRHSITASCWWLIQPATRIFQAWRTSDNPPVLTTQREGRSLSGGPGIGIERVGNGLDRAFEHNGCWVPGEGQFYSLREYAFYL